MDQAQRSRGFTLSTDSSLNLTDNSFALRTPQPIVVELGNVGLRKSKEHVSGLLLRSHRNHPLWIHVGIDLSPCTLQSSSTLLHISADFLSGLEGLGDHSVDKIVSRFAVGYYNSKGAQIPLSNKRLKKRQEHHHLEKEVEAYTAEILDIACRKLKPKGVLYIQVCESVEEVVLRACGRATQARLISKNELDITGAETASYWAKELGKSSRLFLFKIRPKNRSII